MFKRKIAQYPGTLWSVIDAELWFITMTANHMLLDPSIRKIHVLIIMQGVLTSQAVCTSTHVENAGAVTLRMFVMPLLIDQT